MAAENIVELKVTAADETAAGMDSAKESAVEGAGAEDEYAAALDRAAEAEARFKAAEAEQAAALEDVNKLQADSSASADELSAAQARLTEATTRSLDAQLELGKAELDVSAATKESTDATEAQAAKTSESGGLMAAAGSKMKMALVGVAIGAGLAVHAAGNFQQTTERLVTSAGESAKNLGMVQHGILGLSSATNTSTSQLAAGMYTVESAGYHGADGLKVLKAAAQGAQAEGASLSTVANAVTSGLNAYGLSAEHATGFTNQMLAAVGQGKMTMEALAGSLAAVLPAAAAAHLSFGQVGGAIATMTAQGTSADEASQLLRHTIVSLQGPSQVQANEMQQLGINSNDLARNLGQNGLTGTIDQLEEAILHHMGPAGTVLLSAFNRSKLAAQSAQEELDAMPPSLREVARGFLDGSTSIAQWQQLLSKGSLPANQKALLEQFAATANAAHGFNSMLKSGQGDAQTFTSALSKVMGGAEGLQVAMQVGGAHMATFEHNVTAVGQAGQHAGQNIHDWSMIQGQFNFQMGAAEKSLQAAGMALGTALLPAVTAIIHPLADMLGLIAGNKAASIALAIVVGGVLAGALGTKLAGAFGSVKGMVTSTGEGLSWLAGKLGIATAATEAQTVATEEATVAQEGADVAMDANPIGAVIMAITALIAVIVLVATHWRDLEHWTKDALHGIEDAAKAAWHGIDSGMIQPIEHGISDVRGFFEGLYHDGEHNLDMLREAVVSRGEGILNWFEALPGRIVGFLARLPGMLFSAGVHAVDGLIHGLESMIGEVGSTVSSIASKVAGFFGLSPAREGPLSGGGAPYIRGQHFGMDLAGGLDSVRGQLGAAGARAAASMAPGRGPALAGAGGGGGGYLEVRFVGSSDPLIREVLTQLRFEIKGAGGNVQNFLGRGG